jgi:hypothetical protein
VKTPVEILFVENSSHHGKETGNDLRTTLDDIVAKTAAFRAQHLEPKPAK